jgi:hypothetical protein
MFGFTAARWSGAPERAGDRDLGGRRRRITVRLPGTVDSSPVYAAGVRVGGRACDVFVVTTSYGRTLAIDAHTGARLWTFTPAGIKRWEGSSQFTTASPALDPGRGFVFATSPDGRVHKLRLADGREAGGAWPVAVTRDPGHEKLPSALGIDRGQVLVTTGGYLGDAPPYRGHVIGIDARSGRLGPVFNALCADRRTVLEPSACRDSGAAMWGRAGVTVDPGSGRRFVATGNAPWDGRRAFGDSVLMLAPGGTRLAGSYTPANQADLAAGDIDLGSTSPVPLPDGLVVQSGKDGRVRLLDPARMGIAALGGPAELQNVPAPAGQGVFSAPAVATGPTLVVYANFSETVAYAESGGRLRVAWRRALAGTSPVIVGRRLALYDPGQGRLRILDVRSGRTEATLPAAPGHWNSPVAGGGAIALPVGDANAHETSGTLYLYRTGGG